MPVSRGRKVDMQVATIATLRLLASTWVYLKTSLTSLNVAHGNRILETLRETRAQRPFLGNLLIYGEKRKIKSPPYLLPR